MEEWQQEVGLELDQSHGVDSTNVCKKVLQSDETKTDLFDFGTKCKVWR